MNDKSYDRVLSAVMAAALTNIDDLTADRIEALAGGHGMLNLSMFTVGNVIAEEILRGSSIEVKFANVRHLPMEDVLKKAVDTAKLSGADGANAALIAACMMYFAGAAAQVGIPAGNRKLGATARMIAGVDRCGVAAIPTSKMNSKVSGFAAVKAIYDAMAAGELTSIDGRNIPMGVAGAIYGHSALGEDYVWPELAKNGARIGTKAMLDAMHGVGIGGNPFQAAVLGAAAILEIIHPDAEVPEGEGKYNRTTSAYLVGKSAAETAGLPPKLHMRITGEEYDTAQLVGDVGLILKDIGGTSVVGMMTFAEIFGCFKERISGGSMGAQASPLGHMTSYTVPVMLALAAGGDPAEIGRLMVEDRMNGSLNHESSLLSIYLTASKADGIRRGPVSKLMIDATLPFVTKAVAAKTAATYEALKNGNTLAETVKALDNERVKVVEEGTSRYWKIAAGRDISLRFLKLENGARRTEKQPLKYFAFDPLVDLEITLDGKTFVMEHFTDRILPESAMGGCGDMRAAIPFAVPSVQEVVLSGCNLLNIVVPAAAAVCMGYADPKEAAAEAEAAAYITGAIPGGKAAAAHVAKLAAMICKEL